LRLVLLIGLRRGTLRTSPEGSKITDGPFNAKKSYSKCLRYDIPTEFVEETSITMHKDRKPI